MNKYQFLSLWSTTSIGGGVGGYYYGSAGGAEEGLAPVKPQEEWQKWWNDIVKNEYKTNNDDARRKLEYDLGRCSKSFWRFGSLTNKKTLQRRKENSISSKWIGCAHIDLRTADLSNNNRVLAGRWEIVVRNGDKGIILGGLVTPDYEKSNQLAFRGWVMEMKRTNGWWDLESIKGWTEKFKFFHAVKENGTPTGFHATNNKDKLKGLVFGKGWTKDSPWDWEHDRLVKAYNVCKLKLTDNTSVPDVPVECPTYEQKGLPFDLLKVNNTVFWTTKDTGANAKPLSDLFKVKIAKGDGTIDENKKISLWSELNNLNSINTMKDKWDRHNEWQSASNGEQIKMQDLKNILGLDQKYKLENLVY